MYKSLRIRNFRGFHDLVLDDLARINLFAGKNNSGKTALLEALLLLQGVSPEEVIASLRRVEWQRRWIERPGTERIRTWLPGEMEAEVLLLFNQMDLEKVVEITSQIGESERQSLKIAVKKWSAKELKELLEELPSSFIYEDFLRRRPIDRVFLFEYQARDRNYRIFYIIAKKDSLIISDELPALGVSSYRGARDLFLTPEIIGDYGNLEKAGETEIVLQLLKFVEPRIERLVTIYDDRRKEPILYGVMREMRHRMPLYVMGDGMIRLVDLGIRLGNARNGILLIDEFENGLHWSVLPKVWEALGEIARQLNVQVFATTHSYECVKSAHEAFSKRDSYDFRLYRLEEVEGEIQAVAYDRETLGIALEARLEVR
jgi:AAA15 family ATPase/GTPase